MARRGFGRGPGYRQFSLECLESRAMLAGNVTATVSGGNLIVRGDSAANEVAIAQISQGTYVVAGLPGTHIVGGIASSGGEIKTLTGVNGNIDVDLKGGDDLLGVGNELDTLLNKAFSLGFPISSEAADFASDIAASLTLAQLTVPRDLIIRMGGGSDGVGIIANVNERINADLGSGQNAISIDPTFVGDDIILRAGNGNDYAEILDTDIDEMLDVNLGDGANELYVENSQVGQSLVAVTGKGNDEIDLASIRVRDNVIVRTGGGHDDVYLYDEGAGPTSVGKTVNIDTSSGNDYVELSAQVGVIAKINTGDGSDEVYSYDASIGDDLIINTGDNIDSVYIGGDVGSDHVEVGDDLLIDVGSGHDISTNFSSPFGNQAGVFLDDVTVHDNLEVHLGSGRDSLFASLVSVGHDALVDAGDGNDNVSLDDCHVANVFVALMGSGNDTLQITNSTAKKSVLRGGSGDDTLESDVDPNNPPAGAKIDAKEFEHFTQL